MKPEPIYTKLAPVVFQLNAVSTCIRGRTGARQQTLEPLNGACQIDINSYKGEIAATHMVYP